MIRTTVLDPNRTGKDATDFETGLRRQVVGQDEARNISTVMKSRS